MPASADRQAAIRRRIEDSIALRRDLLASDATIMALAQVAALVSTRLKAGGKVLFFGNGGSAADAQHLAAELLGRFYHDRAALPAIALADNVAAMTAIANDYEYADVYARQLAGLAQPGDVAIGLSTSGESENVVRAIALARERGVHTVAFTREGPNRLADAAEHSIAIPSEDTPRIQEAHMLLGHTLCELVEEEMMARDRVAT
jgi:D-sedoheptulose 7-phosphate isomerase